MCNQKIEANFGMVQCPQCQSVLFIDFSGNIVIGGADVASEEQEQLNSSVAQPPPFYFESPSGHNPSLTEEEGDAGFSLELPAAEEVFSPTQKEDTDVGIIELTKNEYSEVKGNHELSDAPFWDQPASEAQDNEYESLPPQQHYEINQNPGAVSHQESSATPSAFSAGSMNYKIQIKGIDSSSLRQSILNTFKDKRLGLVSDEIKGKIDQGELIIMGLNPVKASMIMNTLKDLPIEINWELYGKEESPPE